MVGLIKAVCSIRWWLRNEPLFLKGLSKIIEADVQSLSAVSLKIICEPSGCPWDQFKQIHRSEIGFVVQLSYDVFILPEEQALTVGLA